MKDKLALFGGKKTRVRVFPAQPGPDDSKSYFQRLHMVLRSRILSGYRGNGTSAFWGGEQVQAFERDIEMEFDIPHAITCNSATSGLWMACQAIGLKPGDEVIVTPWSMSCSATVPLLFGAIPVFADISAKTFCLDPEDVRKKVTSRTKAIIAVDLFGQMYDPEINVIAKECGIFVIEDAAQAIGVRGFKTITTRSIDGTDIRGEKVFAGLSGDIGVFSFTQGKHTTAGEGGCCVTADSNLAKRLAMARNHAEAVHKDNPDNFPAWTSTVGLNLRMTEMQAAILQEELRRLSGYLVQRYNTVYTLRGIAAEYGFSVEQPELHPGHAYYVCPITVPETLRPYTKEIAEALRAELMPDAVRIDRGVPVSAGYIDPLYLMPLFQERQHWAFGLKENEGHSGVYAEGTCPVAESLTKEGLIITLLHGLELSSDDRQDMNAAFRKVFCYYTEKIRTIAG